MAADDSTGIKLVVNADGFGINASVSRGILRAHRDGIVTSTSIIGNCADVDAVRGALAEVPGLGVGVHLTLAGGAPVANATAVRSLVRPDGSFPERPRDVFVAWGTGHLKPDDVEREFDAQVTRLLNAGLTLDHLSTHLHIGFLPTIGRAVEAVARKHGIPGVRMAVERPTLDWVVELPRGVMAAALGGLAWMTRRQIGALRHGPQTWGYVESGRLDEVRILEIVGRLGPGAHELICHPIEDGAKPPQGELRALTSPLVRHAVAQRGVTLCRWADLF